MPCIKRVYKDKNRRWYTPPQPRTKSARSLGDKPRINRLSTGCQPRVSFPRPFAWDLACPCFRRDVPDSCIRCPGKQEGRSTPGPSDPSVSRCARLCPAPLPRRAPLQADPLVVYLGFGFVNYNSGDVSSMPWRVCGTLVSWANCSVGVPSCPAPPRRPAVRPDPTRP